MTAGSMPASMASGCIIFSIELLPSSMPISIIIVDSARPARYSTLPCPKGCSASGFFAAIAKPSSVIIDEPASERLLNASAVIATEPDMRPAKYLTANSRMFRNIPQKEQSLP